MNTSTPYDRLMAHYKKNVYTKGAYKGDAPVAQRSKSHFRILNPANTPGEIRVIFWHTDILIATADSVTCYANGHESQPTTKAALSEALTCALGGSWRVYSRALRRVPQAFVWHFPHEAVVFHDGITFSPEGKLLSTPAKLRAKRKDKVRTRAFYEGIKASGFKDVFPVLYAAVERRQAWVPHDVVSLLADAAYAYNWPGVVAAFAFDGNYGNPKKISKEQCWSRIMACCTADMTKIVEVEDDANI